MNQAIQTAVKALDIENDNHWTADGLPRLDTVKMLASDPTVTRETVNDAAPGFTRANAASYILPVEEAAIAEPSKPETAKEGAQPESGAAAAVAPAPPPPPPTVSPVSTSGNEGDDSEGNFSEDKPEQPEVEVSDTGSNEIESLEAQVADAENEIAEIEKALAEGKSALNKMLQAKDDLIGKLTTLRPKDDTPAAIQLYLASQKKLLQERGARRKLITESGLDLKQLAADAKSPLDSALSRRKTRGSERPKMGN